MMSSSFEDTEVTESAGLSNGPSSSRAGRWRSNLKGEAAFESFVPADLQDVELRYDAALAQKLAAAEFALGNLRAAYASLDDDAQSAVAEKLLDREATASWELSADRAPGMPTFEDGFIPILSFETMLRAPEDAAEIDDLKEAIEYAADPFDDLPISRRLLARAHFLATQGPRYEKKYPGEVRRSPSWMGEQGASLSEASFVFPAGDDLEHALSQLERCIHDDDAQPELVKVALAHYQFEVTHPFIDGNGRIGRLLTNLMLRQADRIPPIVLPISDVLNTRAAQYYDLIALVETEGTYEEWVGFYLDVIREAAEQAASCCAPAVTEERPSWPR